MLKQLNYKFFSLSKYILLCAALLVSFKSFAACPNGITGSITCTGDITTTEDEAYGIFLFNTGSNITNTVNMTGNITTAGAEYSTGIRVVNFFDVHNNSNLINMRGNITILGDYAEGIELSNYGGSDSNISTVNLKGNITTIGEASNGINFKAYGGSNSNTVNMTGRISATGEGSYAILAEADPTNSNTVQLNKGSSIIGGISGIGTNNFLKLNLGAGASYSFETTGFTVQDLNGRPMVAGSAHAAGVGNITTASQSLYERTSQITQSLDDRVRTYDAKQNTSQDFWINTY
jgi:hypothetical protein